jgi:alkylhydroperoxidase family enzyme
MPIHLGQWEVMMVDVNDGGAASLPTDDTTDDWSGGGSAALAAYAPAVSLSFATLVGVRPSGVFDELLADPAVAAFADQFRVDVSRIDESQRADFATRTGKQQLAVAQMVWISDVAPRLRAALDTLFGPSPWPDERRYPVSDVWTTIENFMASVARLNRLDPTLSELVRLRGARQHVCRLCMSRRSVEALEDGADDETFEAVDQYESSDLPVATKAALALVDAMIWTPDAVPADVVDAVRAELTPAQAVEVVLDVVRNAANKIAVALGADAPEITEGVQLFRTDADGVLTTV